MNIIILLILFILQTVRYSALGSLVAQTKCSNCQTSLSIPETPSLNASGDENEDLEKFTLSTIISHDNGITLSSKIMADGPTTASASTFQTVAPILLLTTSHLESTAYNRVYSTPRTSTKKLNSTKNSKDVELFILIPLILIALTLMSVALVLLLLIQKYRTKNRRSLGV
ncbi:uncharacterized protein LOC119084533 [Bradysia coprophila]|uniref:uncharacterized protein LOC119084533 n=1 Tax=Bradysia coprophila TaxID=38358 RepID=UPI00187DD429|nr:uncharacterized protein LOC119084533 [Bradysia coprophila]